MAAGRAAVSGGGGAIILEPGIRGSAQFSAQPATSLASIPSNPVVAVDSKCHGFLIHFPTGLKKFFVRFWILALRRMFCSPT